MRDSEVTVALIPESGTAPPESSGTSYECEVRSVTLTPDVSIEKVKTLCPTGQYSNAGTPEWEIEIGYLTGYWDDGSVAFSDFIMQNIGKKADVYFRPLRGGTGWKVLATIQPGPIGGEEGSFSEQSVTWPVDGQPEALTAETSTIAVTGVSGGTPGSFQPANATLPADLVTLAADPVIGDAGTSAPGAAWTTGQYVILGDTSHANWNGTNWVTGDAA
jgi:hypothetical protein